MNARRERPTDGLYIVGVTGGIGSGKSTLVPLLVAAMPSERVDADRLGHAVLEQPAVAHALAAEFGADVLDGGGRVQRAVVGARAFAAPARLAALDAITRPPLLALVEATLREHAERGFVGQVVLDAALLVEWDRGSWCDHVIAVVADPAARARRLIARTGLDEAAAARRIAAQRPDAARAADADDAIANDGTIEEFLERGAALAARVAGLARAALAARGHVL
ncbi:MAG: dephospho-CoA kinase [Candidatus Eisenbacteria bacterium]